MKCAYEELFVLKECGKCGGRTIWKISRYADGCLEQCLGCGEMVERTEVIEYQPALPYPADGEAAARILDLKREHEAVRVHIGRVEDCIRDGERLLNSPGEDYSGRLRRQAFTLFYTLVYLKEAAQRHEEKEEELLGHYLEPGLIEFISKEHEEVRVGIAHAAEVIGKVLPGEVDKNKLQEFCVCVRRLLEPLFVKWKEHLAVADSILDTLSMHVPGARELV